MLGIPHWIMTNCSSPCDFRSKIEPEIAKFGLESWNIVEDATMAGSHLARRLVQNGVDSCSALTSGISKFYKEIQQQNVVVLKPNTLPDITLCYVQNDIFEAKHFKPFPELMKVLAFDFLLVYGAWNWGRSFLPTGTESLPKKIFKTAALIFASGVAYNMTKYTAFAVHNFFNSFLGNPENL